MREEKLKEFSEKIGAEFTNLDLLDEALTHRSYLNERGQGNGNHNERLEFLGDAVLELIISEYLFNNYPDHPEGDLTSFRAATVKTDSLAETSREMEAGRYMKMSKGEEATGGRDKDYLLANVYEAILGAIYIDQSYKACQKFVEETLVPKIKNIVKYRLDIDPKTRFQEISQKIFKLTPTYKKVSEEGPDHEKIFTMAVYVGDKELGQGRGSSKQRAEEKAAEQALKNLKKHGKSTRTA
jgi:ribonuclease-3